MNVVLVSIKDNLTGFSELHQAASAAAAIRSFGDSVRESKLISSHVHDFALYSVGVFDVDSGELHPQLEYLCSASDFLNGGNEGRE